jgi:PAS domain S-box-containing protein
LACFAVSEFSLIRPVALSGIKDITVDLELIYFVNFLFASLIIALIIFFQSKLQHKSEQVLIKKDKALKESEERFRLAVEGTNAGIWDWENINKDQQWWSPKLYELLGYQHQEITPNKVTFKNLLAEESDYPRLVKDFQKHFIDKKPFSVEYRFRVKDGSYRWFQGSGQAKWNDGERPLRMVGSLVDITEKKNKEDEIREKNKLLEKTNAELDRFVYSVSHDLRAPLNSIQGLINIGETTNDIAELKPLMGLMSNRVKKLYGFIDDVISFAKNTRTEIQKDEIDLKNFLEEIVNNAKFRDHASTIDFQLLVSDGLKISSDASRLAVILNNLVDNAIKYHRHEFLNKYIKISAEERNGKILLEVEDNGQGIPQQAQDKIFDMFFRASDNSNGSGLGLYIVKDMVERISGTVSLSSKYGEGTTFMITLPQC